VTDGTQGEDRRRAGLEKMAEVYGWDPEAVGAATGDFMDLTIEHLFGAVWQRGVLDLRERRLVLVALLVGMGLHDVAELQIDAGLRQGDLRAEDVRELVVFLAHYAGWPRGAKLYTATEEIIRRHESGAARG